MYQWALYDSYLVHLSQKAEKQCLSYVEEQSWHNRKWSDLNTYKCGLDEWS